MTAPILLPNNQKDIPLVATALFPMSYVCRASVLDQDGGHSLVQYFDLPHLTVDSVIIVTASAQSCFSQAATAVAPNHPCRGQMWPTRFFLC